MAAGVSRELARHGLTLDPGETASLSILPLPRIRLSRLSVTDETGARLVSNASVAAELRIVPLLGGRAALSEIVVTGARIGSLAGRVAEGRWRGSLRQAAAAFAPAPDEMPRIVLRDASLDGDARPGESPLVADLELTVSGSRIAGEIDVAGSGLWRGQVVRATLKGFDLAGFGGSVPDTLAFSATSDLGRIQGRGELSWSDGRPLFAGQLAVATPSLDGTLRWIGFSPGVPAFARALAIEGSATASPTGFGWTAGTVRLGEDSGEGSLAIGMSADRPFVRGTLAAGDLDLGWVARRLWHDIAGEDHRRPPLADYDIRLSAARLRIGRLHFVDAAAGILVGRGRFELSLARAGLAGGQAKARLSAAFDEDGTSGLRGQVSTDRVDLHALLDDLGVADPASGRLTAQANFETEGRGRAAILAALRGRVFASVKDGELPASIRAALGPRAASRLASAGDPVAWAAGRAPFETAHVNVSLADGHASISDGEIVAGVGRTALSGQGSLLDGTATVSAVTRTTGEPERGEPAPFVFRASGRLDQLLDRPSTTGQLGTQR